MVNNIFGRYVSIFKASAVVTTKAVTKSTTVRAGPQQQTTVRAGTPQQTVAPGGGNKTGQGKYRNLKCQYPAYGASLHLRIAKI